RPPLGQGLWGGYRSASLPGTYGRGTTLAPDMRRWGRPSTSAEEGMAWVVLFVAGLLEIVWAVGLKYTEGFTRLWPSIATAVAMIGSMGLLGVALRTLPLGTAYAIWTGIGSVGTAVLGIVLFREPATEMRLPGTAPLCGGVSA